MSIPDYQSAMLPLLRLAADGNEHRFRDAVEKLAIEFHLTNDERVEMLPSGTAPLFDNRIGWARTYLKQAGLLESPKRGIFRITDQGKQLLAENPARIDIGLLERYEGFRTFRTRKRDTGADVEQSPAQQDVADTLANQTPEDLLASAYRRLRKNLELELLEQVRSASAAFFERLVIDLLVAMGYGG